MCLASGHMEGSKPEKERECWAEGFRFHSGDDEKLRKASGTGNVDHGTSLGALKGRTDSGGPRQEPSDTATGTKESLGWSEGRREGEARGPSKDRNGSEGEGGTKGPEAEWS